MAKNSKVKITKPKTGRGKLIVNKAASGGPLYTKASKRVIIKTIGKFIEDLP